MADDDLIPSPPPWPDGRRSAAAVTFDVDVDSMLWLTHGARAASRASAMSWLRYDLVAVPRLLRIYRARGLRQTFFFPGWCLERHPHLVEAVLADDHEVALHGYQHEVFHELGDAGAEEALLDRSLEIAERRFGIRPVGWRGPLYGISENTPRLLVERGFRYDSSLMGDDVPYLLDTPAGTLVELPTEWANDDWVQYGHSPDLDYQMQIRAPDRAFEVFAAEFRAAHRHRALWVSVWHPNVSGRLARAEAVCRLLDEIVAAGAWLAPLRDIATHFRDVVDSGRHRPRRVDVADDSHHSPEGGPT